jgi:hypothetical protein
MRGRHAAAQPDDTDQTSEASSHRIPPAISPPQLQASRCRSWLPKPRGKFDPFQTQTRLASDIVKTWGSAVSEEEDTPWVAVILIFLRATDEDKFSGQATSVGIQTAFVINKINGAFARWHRRCAFIGHLRKQEKTAAVIRMFAPIAVSLSIAKARPVLRHVVHHLQFRDTDDCIRCHHRTFIQPNLPHMNRHPARHPQESLWPIPGRRRTHS